LRACRSEASRRRVRSAVHFQADERRRGTAATNLGERFRGDGIEGLEGVGERCALAGEELLGNRVSDRRRVLGVGGGLELCPGDGALDLLVRELGAGELVDGGDDGLAGLAQALGALGLDLNRQQLGVRVGREDGRGGRALGRGRGPAERARAGRPLDGGRGAEQVREDERLGRGSLSQAVREDKRRLGLGKKVEVDRNALLAAVVGRLVGGLLGVERDLAVLELDVELLAKEVAGVTLERRRVNTLADEANLLREGRAVEGLDVGRGDGLGGRGKERVTEALAEGNLVRELERRDGGRAERGIRLLGDERLDLLVMLVRKELGEQGGVQRLEEELPGRRTRIVSGRVWSVTGRIRLASVSRRARDGDALVSRQEVGRQKQVLTRQRGREGAAKLLGATGDGESRRGGVRLAVRETATEAERTASSAMVE
jgi:hypothetical protein